MERFIPYEKLSKKQKKLRDAARRGSWGGLSPVTRRTENPKAYRRKTIRIVDNDPDLLLSAERLFLESRGRLW